MPPPTPTHDVTITTAKTIYNRHPRLVIPSCYTWLGSWRFILVLAVLNIAKFAVERVTSVKICVVHRHNCTETWRRRRLNGRYATINDVKGRSDGVIEQQCGRIYQFGCTKIYFSLNCIVRLRKMVLFCFDPIPSFTCQVVKISRPSRPPNKFELFYTIY